MNTLIKRSATVAMGALAALVVTGTLLVTTAATAEGVAQLPPPTATTTERLLQLPPLDCPADWNHNGAVDVGDIVLVIKAYGTKSWIGDIVRVVHDFGKSCPTDPIPTAGP